MSAARTQLEGLAAAYTEEIRLVDSCARVCSRQFLRGRVDVAETLAEMMVEHETNARDYRATLADLAQALLRRVA